MTKAYEITGAGVAYPNFDGKPLTMNLSVKDFNYMHSSECTEVVDHDTKVWEHSGDVWENKSLFGQRGQFMFGFKRRYDFVTGENKSYYMTKSEYQEAKGMKVVMVMISGDPCFISFEEAERILREFIPYAHLNEDGYVTYTFAERFVYEEEQMKQKQCLEARTIDFVRMEKRSYDVSVHATLNDGEEIHLFDFYPDEIHFTASELTGLSVKNARGLRHKKDVAYLRS